MDPVYGDRYIQQKHIKTLGRLDVLIWLLIPTVILGIGNSYITRPPNSGKLDDDEVFLGVYGIDTWTAIVQHVKRVRQHVGQTMRNCLRVERRSKSWGKDEETLTFFSRNFQSEILITVILCSAVTYFYFYTYNFLNWFSKNDNVLMCCAQSQFISETISKTYCR